MVNLKQEKASSSQNVNRYLELVFTNNYTSLYKVCLNLFKKILFEFFDKFRFLSQQKIKNITSFGRFYFQFFTDTKFINEQT